MIEKLRQRVQKLVRSKDDPGRAAYDEALQAVAEEMARAKSRIRELEHQLRGGLIDLDPASFEELDNELEQLRDRAYPRLEAMRKELQRRRATAKDREQEEEARAVLAAIGGEVEQFDEIEAAQAERAGQLIERASVLSRAYSNAQVDVGGFLPRRVADRLSAIAGTRGVHFTLPSAPDKPDAEAVVEEVQERSVRFADPEIEKQRMVTTYGPAS